NPGKTRSVLPSLATKRVTTSGDHSMKVQKMLLFLALTASPYLLGNLAAGQSGPPLGFVTKLGVDVDVRSGGRILQDDLLSSPIILPESAPDSGGGSSTPQIQLRGDNVQVNDATIDYTQTFTGFRPFVRFTQSEVSTAAFNRNIVVTYNTSAGIHVSPNPN